MDAWEFAGGEYHLVNVFNTFFLLNSIAKSIYDYETTAQFRLDLSLIDFLWPVKNSFQNYWLQLFFEPLFGRQKINFSVRSFHYETFRKDSWDFLLLFILLKEALTFVYFSIFLWNENPYYLHTVPGQISLSWGACAAKEFNSAL